MNRREFLKRLSGAGLGLGISSWLTEQLWALYQEGKLEPRPAGMPLETWTNSVCTLCRGGCGIRVRNYEGFPVQLIGNPLSPVSGGGLCPLGAAGLQMLYHPDRIQSPLVRTGERGENRWKEVSWNEGLQQLQARLQKLRQSGDAHRVAFLEERSEGTLGLLIAQFMRAYGSPNHVCEQGPDPAQLAFEIAQGEGGTIAYDLPNARFILSFGYDLLEAEGAPVWQNLNYGRLRTSRHEDRATFVQVEPHLSLTASQADRWVPVRPGTEAAFALGIAHVLVAEGLYDREFVERNTFGFEDWSDADGNPHIGFKTLLLREYSPGTVSQLTDVPVEELREVALAFGKHAASLAIAGQSANGHTNGLFTQLAVQALNALTGSIGRTGGVFRSDPIPLAPLAAFEPDNVAQLGLKRPPLDGSDEWPLLSDRIDRFLDGIENRHPYPLDTLLLYQANPLFTAPDPRRLERAFKQIPFVVSFSSFMDETTRQADLILPTHTYLESWGDVNHVPGLTWGYAALQQPLIKPLHQTRHLGELLIQIARGLGDGTARAFPEVDFVQTLQRRYRGLFESGKGQIVGDRASNPPETFEEFWTRLLEQGAWVSEDSEPGKVRFSTPSGRYEFFAQKLQSHPTLQDAADAAFLPHFTPPSFAGDPVKYPYHLVPFDTNTLFGGRGALLPLMMEMVGFRQDISWDSWIEINPATGEQLDLQDGDLVWVESDQGRIRTQVKLLPSVAPDVVAMPLGLGHDAYGRYAEGRGANPNLVLAQLADPLIGRPARLATRVRIVKA